MEEKLAALDRLEPSDLMSSIENSIPTHPDDDVGHTISNVLLQIKTAEKEVIISAIKQVSIIQTHRHLSLIESCMISWKMISSE